MMYLVDQSRPCTQIILKKNANCISLQLQLEFRKITRFWHAHVANIYTCTRPHPLYHARTPATRDSASGRYVEDTILAGLVSKNPRIWMTELCRLSSSVGKALVRITRDTWFESRLRSILVYHIVDPDVIGPLPTSIVSQENSCSKHIYMYPPAPLVSRPHPATWDSASGRYVDDTIIAGLVSKNPRIWMTELCRLSSSVGRALVRITRDPWFESRLRSILFCHTLPHNRHSGQFWDQLAY